MVTCVDRSAEALARLKATTPENRPHVLISDLAMPKQDGVWLMKAVRALPRAASARPRLDRVHLPGDRDSSRKWASRCGSIKPMDPVALVDAVRTLAGRDVVHGPA